ncbi:nuclear receptor coactivator, putative [Acanthamoeba castellanii str. Neff]|uniref:Oxidation resistance protein 1 n=1 Tax=Acanthamoeba castellanii (strain ATCC 30010 / Neff) TaxID=1257118 RepID=L8GM61_ACACF|nr:nuclear receptor coactivator, putative [Acanthamoeba castellanii str. Neff]ELR13311.1 nuclear receptor coactivator, putative [Acanthamoeba castellanii str. Neff]
MEKHKAGNALSHNRRQKAGASLPRRSMMLPAESAGSAADPVLHEGPSSLLLIDDIRAIQNMLPARERSCDWKLVYSSDKHGVSLNTFYTRARNKGPTVMIVEDSMHHLYPKKAFYLWTGANNFVQLSGEDFLSVGGGSGTMGLWLNDDFSGGSSQTEEFSVLSVEVWGFVASE